MKKEKALVYKAIVKTKSNFRNLNGKELDIVDMNGTRVSCSVFDENVGKDVTVDFNLKEVVSFVSFNLGTVPNEEFEVQNEVVTPEQHREALRVIARWREQEKKKYPIISTHKTTNFEGYTITEKHISTSLRKSHVEYSLYLKKSGLKFSNSQTIYTNMVKSCTGLDISVDYDKKNALKFYLFHLIHNKKINKELLEKITKEYLKQWSSATFKIKFEDILITDTSVKFPYSCSMYWDNLTVSNENDADSPTENVTN